MNRLAGARPRTPSVAVRLAWFALGASYVLVLAGIALRLLVEPFGSYSFWLEVTVNAQVFVTLGALVASKRPDHSIGWLLLGIGLAMSLQLSAGNYAAAALPMGAIAAWVAEQLRLAGLGALVFVMLLFPTGRLPSRRWRTVGWLALIGLGALFVRVGTTLASEAGPWIRMFPARSASVHSCPSCASGRTFSNPSR